jgi:hypothetical protein
MTGGESQLEIATSCGTSESALDADVVIAFLDPPDAHHQRAVEVLGTHLVGGDGVLIAAIAYTEVIVRPLQYGTDAKSTNSSQRWAHGWSLSTAPLLDEPLSFEPGAAPAASRRVLARDPLAHSAELLTLDRGQRRIADHESEG